MFTAETLKSKSLSKESRIVLSQKLKRFANHFDSDGWMSFSLDDKVNVLKILADLLWTPRTPGMRSITKLQMN